MEQTYFNSFIGLFVLVIYLCTKTVESYFPTDIAILLMEYIVSWFSEQRSLNKLYKPHKNPSVVSVKL